MQYRRIILLAFSLTGFLAVRAQIGGMLKDKVRGRVQNEESSQMDKGLDKAEGGIKDSFKKKKKSGADSTVSQDKSQESPAGNDAQKEQVSNTVASGEQAEAKPLKVYQNYDFIPGDKILFEDNFMDDQDGEFPMHWKLDKGQAIVNKVDGKPSLLLTEGNYARVSPRMKTAAYLPEAFTLEFDFIFKKGEAGGYGYQPQVEFYYMHEGGYESSFIVGFGQDEVKIEELFKSYPAELKKDFNDKWHHAALVFKNGQMKAYVDQYRTCVNPNIDKKLLHIVFDGIGDESKPIIFTNVRLAEGGGMNLVGKKFTESRIVTHGIAFDVNKATIRPESMGTLNMIAQLMKENPDLKFEVGGHTDSDGGDAENMKLSQARADAVKAQLTSMGVAADRLTAKGYGETKPVAGNDSPEGKANNRRVEFVKTAG